MTSVCPIRRSRTSTSDRTRRLAWPARTTSKHQRPFSTTSAARLLRDRRREAGQLDRGDLKAAALNAQQAMKASPLEGSGARRRCGRSLRSAVADRAAARIGEEGAHPVPTLQSTRGDILARRGRNVEAETAFRAEIAPFPSTTDSYVRLALLLASEHCFAEIEPTLEAIVKASPIPPTYFLAAREMKDLGNDSGSRSFRNRGERLAARPAVRDHSFRER